MCELFGLSCNKKDRAVRSLPEPVKKDSCCHDSWGIGYHKGPKVIVEHSAEDISKQEVKRKFSNITEQTRNKTIAAQVRKATGGTLDPCNPYSFKTRALERDWIFTHNKNINLNHPERPDMGSEIDSAKLFSHHSSGGIPCLLPEISCSTVAPLVAALSLIWRLQS